MKSIKEFEIAIKDIEQNAVKDAGKLETNEISPDEVVIGFRLVLYGYDRGVKVIKDIAEFRFTDTVVFRKDGKFVAGIRKWFDGKDLLHITVEKVFNKY